MPASCPPAATRRDRRARVGRPWRNDLFIALRLHAAAANERAGKAVAEVPLEDMWGESCPDFPLRGAKIVTDDGGKRLRCLRSFLLAVTTRATTVNPSANLVRGATHRVTVISGTEDKAGNALDQKPAVGGNQAMA